jgi:arginyl-tRNA--protein-N-Asp/Glu arginylyltransferase
MTGASDDQSFLCLNASPAKMDQFWAEGWRHFGILFFRYRVAAHGDKQFSVLPLRIDLEQFTPTRSQKRVLAKNRDTRTVIRPALVDTARERLFAKHSIRYKENIPSSLSDFMSPVPASVPCPNLELCIYLNETLAGVTYLDIGQTATSAVYAMFDPAQATRSLGVLMILRSIDFSRQRGYRYYYPGYAYREPSAYDYKKRFIGLEYLNWTAGWKPYVKELDSQILA